MGPGGQRLLFGEQTGGGTFGGRRLGRQGLRTAPHGTLRATVREQRRHDDLPPATHGCHGHRIVGQNRIHARLGAHAVCPQARRSAAVRRPGGRTARRTAAHRGRGPGTDARKDRKLRGLRSLRDAESLAAGDRLLHPTVESGHEMPLRKREHQFRSGYQPAQLYVQHRAGIRLLPGRPPTVQRTRRTLRAEHPHDGQRAGTHRLHGPRQPRRERRTAENRRLEIQPRPVRLR